MPTIKKKRILFRGTPDLKLPVLQDRLEPLLKRVRIAIKEKITFTYR